MDSIIWATTLFLLITAASDGSAVSSPQYLIERHNSDASNQVLITEASDSSGSIELIVSTENYLEEILQNNCTNGDVFPVPGSCKDFYFCGDWNGKHKRLSISRFTCPSGTIFDSATKTCISPLSNNPNQCEEELLSAKTMGIKDELVTNAVNEQVSKAISTNITRKGKSLTRMKRSNDCNNVELKKFIQSAKDTCANVRNIDTFINDIKSQQTVQVASSDEEEYKSIIINYNQDLRNSQNKYNEWKQGPNSMLSALQEIYQKASQFGTMFNAVFQGHQNTIKTFEDVNFPNLKNMDARIIEMESSIAALEEILNDPSEYNERNFRYLQDSLKEYMNDYKELLTNDKRLVAEEQLRDLISFLSIVISYVDDIQSKCHSTGTKIETFYNTIIQDSGIFLRHHRQVQEGIQRLQNAKKNNDNEKATHLDRKNKLEQELKEDQAATSNYMKLKQNLEKDLRNIEKAIKETQKKLDTQKKIAAGLFVIPIIGWIAGGTLLGVTLTEEKNLATQKRNLINSINNNINQRNAQIELKELEIQIALSRISTLNTNIAKLSAEFIYFGQLDKDLAVVEKNINYILPSINQALNSIGELKQVFDNIQDNLNDILDTAKARKKDAEEKNVVDIIYHRIDSIKCDWDEASATIMPFSDCTVTGH